MTQKFSKSNYANKKKKKKTNEFITIKYDNGSSQVQKQVNSKDVKVDLNWLWVLKLINSLLCVIVNV